MRKSEPRKSGESTSKNFSSMVKDTKRNKIRRIKKALGKAGGVAVDKLLERLKFWEGK